MSVRRPLTRERFCVRNPLLGQADIAYPGARGQGDAEQTLAEQMTYFTGEQHLIHPQPLHQVRIRDEFRLPYPLTSAALIP